MNIELKSGNIMSFFGSHNSSISIYNVFSKKLTIIELEKLLGFKHWQWRSSSNTTKIITWKVIRDIVFPENGIENDFDYIIGGIPEKQTNLRHHISSREFNVLKIKHRNHLTYSGHHLAHSWAAAACFPANKAIIMSYDAGGDDGTGAIRTFDRYGEEMMSSKMYHLDSDYYEKLSEEKKKEIRRLSGKNICAPLSKNLALSLGKISRSTMELLDLPGKMMGASAFGDRNSALYNTSDRNVNKMLVSYAREQYKNDLISADIRGSSNWTIEFGHMPDYSFQEECDISLRFQDNFERSFQKIVEECGVKENLPNWDNNLMITGGSALNIVNNKNVQKLYNCKVHVPPNPNDIGISFGLLARFLFENNIVPRETVLDPTFCGIYPSDLIARRFSLSNGSFTELRKTDFSNDLKYYIDLYEGFVKFGDAKKVSETLKSGNIIGIIQGKSEIGLRSLGARSLLADASVEGIKDKVNVVKRRELYRPFAPICLMETAKEVFDSKYYDNLYHMNVNTVVKEKYREKYKSITHVDNSARLQVVDKSNILMHNILVEHGGVLLNTSLNVSGKPIMNRFIDGFKLLESSGMDFLVIYDHVNDKYVFFSKRMKYGW